MKKTLITILMTLVLCVCAINAITVFAAETSVSCTSTAECTGVYENGICTVCRGYEIPKQVSSTHYPELNATHNGYYAIENAGQLYWYAQEVTGDWYTEQVNGGNNTINAVLTADITVNEKVTENGALISDTSALTVWVPILNEKYTGTLDGNGHIISGLFNNTKYNSSITGNALFGRAPAKIKNLGIVDSYFGTSTQYKSASFIGDAITGARVENCFSSAVIEGLYYAAGIVGSVNRHYSATVENCYFSGKIISGNPNNTSGPIMSEKYGGTVINCYYLNTCGFTSSNRATLITEEQLTNGYLTYKLNSGNTESPVWRQTVGTGYPTFTGDVVYATTPCPTQYSNTPNLALDHTFNQEEWENNETRHYNVCTLCEEKLNISEHTYDENGSCTVCQNIAGASITTSNGETKYCHTLTLAIETAKDGDTVMMKDDNMANATVQEGISITIDLKDESIDGTVNVYGELTLIGSMDNEVLESYCNFDARGNGKIIVNSGKYAWFKAYDNSTVIINDAILLSSWPFYKDADATVLVKNAFFSSSWQYDQAIGEFLAPGTVLEYENGSELVLEAGQTLIQDAFYVKYYEASVDVSGTVTKYTDIYEALEYANSVTGAKITVINDTLLRGQLTVSSDMTLDLNGKTLSNFALVVEDGAKLVIEDSSEAKIGAVKAKPDTATVHI